MNTERLIAALNRNLPPVSPGALERRIRHGLYGGAIVAALLATLLGVRPDLASAVGTFPFWMKWAYTISLGSGALFGLARLARPTFTSLRGLWFLAVPVLLLAGICIGELARAPMHEWSAMWLGRSWTKCPWVVLGLATPIFVGLLRSFRNFAPRRIRAAGAVAGLASGALAATIYCLLCREDSAIFVLTWYSLGIVLAAGVGAILGPRLMRW